MSSASDDAFKRALAEAAARTEECLDGVLPPANDGQVAAAMRHAALNGGKRLRAFLVLEGARLFNVPDVQAARAAAAIECLHAYSLVHDDLPAMDNDALRRGKPTVHVKWDEATAILTGDALQTLAFEVLAHPRTAQDPSIRLKLIAQLARASGVHGMVGGQELDLAAETSGTPLTLEGITDLQAKKTGALIHWAAEAGPILGKSDVGPMHAFAKNLGLAYQIHDDILDVTGDPEAAGKRLRKDEEAGKATFVSLLGLDAAGQVAAGLIDKACDALAPYSSAGDNLRACARYVISREK